MVMSDPSQWVPQLGDCNEVLEAIQRKPGVTYSALVPNMKGFDGALRNKVSEIAVFTAASETFNKTNINCTIKESMDRFVPVLEAAHKENIRVSNRYRLGYAVLNTTDHYFLEGVLAAGARVPILLPWVSIRRAGESRIRSSGREGSVRCRLL